MNLHNYTPQELILMVDNDPKATPMEKELAERLARAYSPAPQKPTPNTQQELQHE